MFRNLVMEAVDETSIIASKIIKKINWLEGDNITKMKDIDYDYLGKLASYHSPRFDDLDDETQKVIMDKIWKRLKRGVKPVEEATPDSQAMSQGQLKAKILYYLKTSGAVLYPMEAAAEALAKELAEVETKPEEK